MQIIVPALIVAALGLVFGGLLAYARKIFAVKTDKTDENCDGINSEFIHHNWAVVMCGGTEKLAKLKYDYIGIEDCAAAMQLAGGEKMCPYGCIGLGSCVKTCPFNAISIKNGVAVVDDKNCRACGICVKSCPKKIIRLIPHGKKYWVGCMTRDKEIVTGTYCEVGCTGCKLCEKVCESGAIRVNGYTAAIDYKICTNCGLCIQNCPRKIIQSKQQKNIEIGGAEDA